VTNVVFSPASPATIALNSRVNITFSYTQNTTTGVRIYSEPLYNGATIAGAGTNPSPLYTTASGTGTGFFQISNPATVNQVRFRIYASNNTTLLYEKTVAVNYTIVSYNLSNIVFSPASPATIATNSRVNISLNYIQSTTTGVRIYCEPLFNGSLISGAGVNPSPLYTTPTGTASCFFQSSSPATVNQVRFRIYASDNTTLLYEKIVAVNYTIVNYNLSNIVFSPASPATIATNSRVNITLNYVQTTTTGVRIYCEPLNNGSLISGAGVNPSPLYTTATGTANCFFQSSSPATVDQVRFRIYASDNTTLLYEKIVAVNYTIVNYDLSGIVFTPASPATIAINNRINISLNYIQTTTTGVRIYCEPLNNGSLISGAGVNPSPLYTTPTGTASCFFQSSSPATVNQVRFRIYASDNTTLLFEKIVAVNYTIVRYNLSDIVFTPASPATIAANSRVNITLNYLQTSTTGVRIYCEPLYNGTLISGAGVNPSPLYTTPTGTANCFFQSSTAGKVNQVRFRIYASDNTTLLYQKIVSVNYTIISYNLSDIVFTPSSPATIGTNSRVNITLNYLQTSTDGVRIYCEPLHNDTLITGAGVNPSPLYTTQTGTANCFFQSSSPATVNKVRFRIYASDNTTLLYEKSVAVNYTILDYNLSNIVFSPASPATIATNSRVNITLSYIQTTTTGVRIYCEPLRNGTLISGAGVNPSPLYTTLTGTANCFFQSSSPATVNQVRFRIYGSDNTTLLYEKIVAVNYSIVNYNLSNIVFTPASPATIATNSRVNITLNYLQTSTAGVRIYCEPLYNGALISGAGVNPSPLYTTETGTASCFFQSSSPATVNQVRFRIYASDNTTLLYQRTVAVNYSIVNYNLSDIVFSPVSPDTIVTNNRVNITLNYLQTSTTGVRIYCEPLYNGALISGAGVNPSPLYTAGTGSATCFFQSSSPATVNEVRFRIYASDNTTLLYEKIVAVNYTITNPAREGDFDFSDVAATAFEVGPVPASDFFNIRNNTSEEFSYQLIDINGLVVKEGKTADADTQIEIQETTPGMYLLRLNHGTEVTEKKVIVQ
jgi:hypothetical protein